MHFWWHLFLLKRKANTSNLGETFDGFCPLLKGCPDVEYTEETVACVSSLLHVKAPWAGVPFLCHAQLVFAHRTLFPGPKGCSGTLLLVVFLCDCHHWHHWQVQELSSDPDIAQSPWELGYSLAIPSLLWSIHSSECHTASPNISRPFLFLTEAKIVGEGYGLEPAADLSVWLPVS